LFQELEATLENFTTPQLVAGVKPSKPGGGATTNGDTSHGSDMASNTSEISSEVSFFANARIKEAQELAYASKQNESIIAILSTGLNLSENTGNLATVLSPLQMDYIGSSIDAASFDTVLDDDYEDYMEPVHLNKGQGTPIALIAHTVAPQSEILPLRVCNDEGQCPTSSVAIGIRHAVNVATAENKKLVINMSFSGAYGNDLNPKDSLLYDLLQAVISPRVVVAADVGNRGLDPRLRFPAAFSNEGLDGIVSVTALQPEGDYSQNYMPAYYSSRGNYIDIAAMGTNVFIGTHLAGEGGYDGGYSGTSFATPWIAGTLALMMDASNSTSWELETCLKSTAQMSNISNASQLEVGAGMLNAEAAVACALKQ
jgi:subtilisin family serine protease